MSLATALALFNSLETSFAYSVATIEYFTVGTLKSKAVGRRASLHKLNKKGLYQWISGVQYDTPEVQVPTTHPNLVLSYQPPLLTSASGSY